MECLKSFMNFIKIFIWGKTSENDTKTHIHFTCFDKPFGVYSGELLIQIRSKIESTKKTREKVYLKLLIDFITVLDYLCHKSSKRLYYDYLDKIKQVINSEDNADYKKLLLLNKKVFLIGLVTIDNRRYTVEKLLNKVDDSYQVMDKLSQKYTDNKFIQSYLVYLKKVSQLCLMRRGIIKN
ncbi:unnamed protein product [Brachionus calyciflorus]|uniref:Uncharacterized protein n=1 Tax=Brachionus calyciflorus TaxID=104777 RepID=A0A813QRZ3_9BILA|nr:unnamed protein product [Brachionus calyciflorus]